MNETYGMRLNKKFYYHLFILFKRGNIIQTTMTVNARFTGVQNMNENILYLKFLKYFLYL